MNEVTRPNPDALLREVREAGRGRLKIFLGAAPGVGKTYAMLSAAQERMRAGEDVVIGVVETHGREETAKLVQDLPLQPLRSVLHGQQALAELDLDGLLKRRPKLALIDEFAHSNVPGSRHAKRYEDVDELLTAGIHVWTTLNIQHIESLNDAVARITGVRVRETVPDSWIEAAQEIELIDLPPEGLIERLKAGKVYLPEQAARAVDRYFSLGNLKALRDLALRTATERADADVDAYLQRHPTVQPWPTNRRILVCVGGDTVSKGVVRAAARIAQSRKQPWTAVHIINSRANTLPNAAKDRIAEILRLAEQLGGEAVTLPGEDVARELLDYARSRNVAQIIVGRPNRSLWRLLLRPSLSFQLFRHGGGFEVTYVDPVDAAPVTAPKSSDITDEPLSRRAVMELVGGLLLASMTAAALDQIVPLANVSLLYLLVVLVVAVRHGRLPAFVTATLSFLAYNFLFTEPRHTFAMDLREEWITLLFFLVVAFGAGQFAAQLRGQMQALRKTARRTANLNEFSRRVARARTVEQVALATVQHVQATLETAAFVIVDPPDSAVNPIARAGLGPDYQFSETDRAAAAWSWIHRKEAGVFTTTLPNARFRFAPLSTSGGMVGVLGISLDERKRPLSPGQHRLLDALCDQAAVALERARLTLEVEARKVSQETEHVRSALLASVSHDLRTPIASVMGASSGLLDLDDRLNADQRRELAQTIFEESQRLDRHVRNLLDMTRLSQAGIRLKEEALDLRDLVKEACASVRGLSPEFSANWLEAPPSAVTIPGDTTLVRTLFINLFENAIRHAKAQQVDLDFSVMSPQAGILTVRDHGPGIPQARRETIFGTFNRADNRDHRSPGTGLGLSICRAIMQLHGGSIEARAPLKGTGTEFRLQFVLAPSRRSETGSE